MILVLFLPSAILGSEVVARAEQVPVHNLEGVTFGFLTLRNTEGQVIADGYLQQTAKPSSGIITDDLQFHFKDGSLYREITKFTQRGTFHLVSNQVTQKGPAF